jgi:hypothetical protein
MKRILVLSALACSLALFGAGCTASEDNSVKAAPADTPTTTADQFGGRKQKSEGEAGPRSGG